jgi:hypothetical protein
VLNANVPGTGVVLNAAEQILELGNDEEGNLILARFLPSCGWPSHHEGPLPEDLALVRRLRSCPAVL